MLNDESGATDAHAVVYVVVKPFKYAGQMLRPGTVFHPGRGQYDAQLVGGLGGYIERREVTGNTVGGQRRLRRKVG